MACFWKDLQLAVQECEVDPGGGSWGATQDQPDSATTIFTYDDPTVAVIYEGSSPTLTQAVGMFGSRLVWRFDYTFSFAVEWGASGTTYSGVFENAEIVEYTDFVESDTFPIDDIVMAEDAIYSGGWVGDADLAGITVNPAKSYAVRGNLAITSSTTGDPITSGSMTLPAALGLGGVVEIVKLDGVDLIPTKIIPGIEFDGTIVRYIGNGVLYVDSGYCGTEPLVDILVGGELVTDIPFPVTC